MSQPTGPWAVIAKLGVLSRGEPPDLDLG